jgi:hypothetical protein
VMWHGWWLSHNRFSLSGDDSTQDLALMVKRFKKKFCQKSKKLEENLP